MCLPFFSGANHVSLPSNSLSYGSANHPRGVSRSAAGRSRIAAARWLSRRCSALPVHEMRTQVHPRLRIGADTTLRPVPAQNCSGNSPAVVSGTSSSRRSKLLPGVLQSALQGFASSSAGDPRSAQSAARLPRASERSPSRQPRDQPHSLGDGSLHP
jgi:hypothetical protein